MWILYVVNAKLVVMFFAFGYFIKYRQAYMLVSGYNMATEEEQKEMEAKGIGSFTGNWMFLLGGWMLVGIALMALNVPFAIEMIYGVLLIATIVMMLQGLKYTPKRLKRLTRDIVIGTTVFIIFLVGAVIYATYSPNALVIEGETLEVTGEFGTEWQLAEIEDYYLTEELPTVRYRTFGAATDNRAKGKFRVEEWGRGQLYVYPKHPPYVVIKSAESFIIINDKNPDVTQQWFEKLAETKQLD